MSFPNFNKNSPGYEKITTTSWDVREQSVYVAGTNILIYFYATADELFITEQHNINILLGLPYGTTA